MVVEKTLQERLREAIHAHAPEPFDSADVQDGHNTPAERIAARLNNMIWPEKDQQVRQAVRAKEVDAEAERKLTEKED